jgi:hypothetical protein
MAMTCQESNVVRTERKVCDDEAADAADCGPAEGSPTTPPSLSDNHIGAMAIFIFSPHNGAVNPERALSRAIGLNGLLESGLS